MLKVFADSESPMEGLAETLIAMIEGRPVAGLGRSGRAGVPPPAADGDGTATLPDDTVHPPVVIDYCIQHLGAVVNELDGAWRVGAHTSSDRFRGSLRSGDTGDRALPDGGVRGVLVRAAPPDKENIVGVNNCGFVARS